MVQDAWLWPTCSYYGWYTCVLAFKDLSTEPAVCKWCCLCLWTSSSDLWLWTIKQSKSLLRSQEGRLHPDRAAHLKCSSSKLVKPVHFWLTNMHYLKEVVFIACFADGEVLWLFPPMRKFLTWSKCRSLGLCLIVYIAQWCLSYIINMYQTFHGLTNDMK